MNNNTLTVVGEGAWGSALALTALKNKYHVTLWSQNDAVAQEITTHHTNRRYLPGIIFDPVPHVVTHLIDALHAADTIIITTPVVYLEHTLRPIAHLLREKKIIIGSKGLDQITGDTPAEIVRRLCSYPDITIATLAGGSFARELIAGAVTNLVIASTNSTIRKHAHKILANHHIICEESTDELGVALAAALKNVYAIGGGILAAIGAGENTHAFYSVVVLREMRTLLRNAQCSEETLWSSAGIGDLILTSLTLESKNRAYGYLRGSGKPHSDWEESGRPYPEGVNTLAALNPLSKRYRTALPIAQALHNITYGSMKPEQLISVLLGSS